MVFPSNSGCRGLWRTPIESQYVGKGENRVEAQAVVDHILAHALNTPTKTLGVVAFGQAQSEQIEDLLEMARKNHPDSERLNIFFDNNINEPFFIKPLELVQGDERDVIIISVGYGYNQDKKLSLNFGPINKAGGEKRLNVLITRAKEECVVFSNFSGVELEQAISRSTSQSEGLKLLANWLKYADDPTLWSSQAQIGKQPDSEFELDVMRVVESLGYSVVPQVGCSGYFIDIGVIDPNDPSKYLLAIECDGATYHSSRIARERDKMRQRELEKLGWTFHRVWSTSWFTSRKQEIEKLKGILENQKVQAAYIKRA